jgi:septal ring factor EnvC (AmiA/AmiB activator)
MSCNNSADTNNNNNNNNFPYLELQRNEQERQKHAQDQIRALQTSLQDVQKQIDKLNKANGTQETDVHTEGKRLLLLYSYTSNLNI